MLALEVAALRACSPCCAAANPHSSRTVAGRDPVAGNVLGDPVAEFCGAAPDEDQVEPAHDRAIPGNEHVEGAYAGVLFSQQGAVPVVELVEELIAAVGDAGGEVGAIGPLEGQYRRRVVGAQPLQLGHRPNLSRRRGCCHLSFRGANSGTVTSGTVTPGYCHSGHCHFG